MLKEKQIEVTNKLNNTKRIYANKGELSMERTQNPTRMEILKSREKLLWYVFIASMAGLLLRLFMMNVNSDVKILLIIHSVVCLLSAGGIVIIKKQQNQEKTKGKR